MTDTPRDPLAATRFRRATFAEGGGMAADPDGQWVHVHDVLGLDAWDLDPAELHATRPSGDDLVLVRRDTGGVFPDGTTNHPAIDFDAPNDATRPSGGEAHCPGCTGDVNTHPDQWLRRCPGTRPSGDEALTRKLHDQRWACSEDRNSCDPAANPAFHDSQLASIGLLSETALSGYGSTLATDPSGSQSVASGSPSDDEALRALEREYNVAVANGHLAAARHLDRRIAALATPEAPQTWAAILATPHEEQDDPEASGDEALRAALARAEAIDTLDYYEDSGSDAFNYDRYREDVVRAALATPASSPPGANFNDYRLGPCIICDQPHRTLDHGTPASEIDVERLARAIEYVALKLDRDLCAMATADAARMLAREYAAAREDKPHAED